MTSGAEEAPSASLTLEDLREKIQKFADDRDWNQVGLISMVSVSVKLQDWTVVVSYAPQFDNGSCGGSGGTL